MTREQIDAFHDLGFLERREDSVFLGPPVEFAREPKAAGRLGRRRRIMTTRRPLIVEEIGYLPVRQSGAVFLLLADQQALRARLGGPDLEQGL